MSLLGSLCQKAQNFFSRVPVAKSETNAVVQDNFDAQVFARCHDTIPALAHLVGDLQQHYGHSYEMMRDVMQLFWQSAPKLNDPKEMNEKYLRNHAVTSDIDAAPDTERMRAMSRLDEYGAVMATLAVGEHVKGFLKAKDELDKAQEEAEAKANEAQEAAEKLQEAMDAASATESSYDGIGPLTAAQSAAEEQLMGALAEAEQAQATAEQSTEEVQKAVAKAADKMDQQIRAAIEAAAEELENELEMFRAWGMNDGEVKKLPFAERAALAQALRGNRLAKFAQLIGRKRLAAAAMRTKRTEYGRDEVVGTELSNDLPRVLASEFTALAMGRMQRLDFLQRFSEGQLLSRKYQGVERVAQGAIIACLDESGSTSQTDRNGITREAWIKATALCLLDQAKAEKRDFVWIAFSSAKQVKVTFIPKGNASIYDVIAIVEHFWNGGTDFMAPMNEALRILDDQYETIKALKGDVVLLTDDDCRVKPDWLQRFDEAKAKLAFRVFGVFCGVPERPNSHLALLSDNLRSAEDFADPNDIADMIRVV